MNHPQTPEPVPGLGRSLLARFLLNFVLLFVYLIAILGIALLVEITTAKAPGLLVLATIALLGFALLFALTWREKVRIHWGWMFTGVLIGIGVFAATFFSSGHDYYSSYRLRKDFSLSVVWLYLTGSAIAAFSLFVHGIRYLRSKDRLKSAAAAIGFGWGIVLLILLCGLWFAFVQNNWELRRTINHGVVSLLAGIATLMFVVSVPLTMLYLQSFLRRMTWKRVILTESIFVLVLLGIAAVVLTPSLGSAQEKAGMRRNFAERQMLDEPTVGAAKDSSDSSAIPASGKSRQGEHQVRVRQHFPETLYWNPELIAKDGKAKITIPVSDSITTFRMTCQGVAADGKLGSMTKGIRVFQDFFVDIDFPVSLTQGDEISVPIQVYNYLATAQTVRFKVQAEDWFEMLGGAENQVTMPSNQVGVVYFRIRVKKVGPRTLTVYAYGDKMSDAVKRPVMIAPAGEKIEQVINGTLAKSVAHTLDIPSAAIEDASKIIVKCYPGIETVLVEGLEGMLRLPGG